MRTLNHFIRLFCFSVIAFSFNSCDKEAELATSQNELIKPRTGSPGSFSVTNGMLNFPTIADFHQTVDYVLEDSTQRENFRSSFSIKTYNKKADIILDSLNNILQSPSAVSSFWPGYASYLDMTISSGDTLFSSKYGIWGDFLNLNNYIEIEGYLYKISDGKTIIITDGDLQKLSLAEGMEESDTTNNIFIISWRSCLCDNTHKQWKREPTITSGNVRTTNRLVFSDLTIVTMLPGQRARITPKWTIETNIRVQKRGFFGWHLERRRIEFSREFNMTHNFQNVNTHTWPDGSWNEYAAWLTGNEGDYSYNSKFQYLPYTAPTYSWTPLGYCFAVRRFAQTGNITNPIINNTYNYYPFPYNNFSGYHPLAPSNSCPPSDILYYL